MASEHLHMNTTRLSAMAVHDESNKASTWQLSGPSLVELTRVLSPDRPANNRGVGHTDRPAPVSRHIGAPARVTLPGGAEQTAQSASGGEGLTCRSLECGVVASACRSRVQALHPASSICLVWPRVASSLVTAILSDLPNWAVPRFSYPFFFVGQMMG